MRQQAWVLGALLGVLSAGCSLVVAGEVDGLEPNLNAKRDVRVTLIDMNPHIGQFNDVQIVNRADPTDPTSVSELEARAVLDPLPTGCFELFWPLGASISADQVDFYADLNMDGMLSPPGDDHLWRRRLAEAADGTGELEFIHDVMFDDIGADPANEPLSDLRFNITGLDDQNGRLLVVSVTRDFRESPEAAVQRTTTGILVVGAIEGGVIDATLPGILDQGSEHTIVLDFAEGTMICGRDITPDATGATIESLADFDCMMSSAPQVFRDVTAERRCAE